MEFYPEKLYHIYNRGINKQSIFFDEKHYLLFLTKIRHHFLPHCHIIAYCLMPNHFHFMVETKPKLVPFAFQKDIGILLRSYTRKINHQRQRTGSLFQQHTKAKILENSHYHYPFICFQYIHQNPIKANLVKKMGNWQFSSFKDYMGLRNGTLCNKRLAYERLRIATNARDFYIESSQNIDSNLIERLF